MVAIIGGGIIGLAIGWRLARAGAAVTVLERGEAARGATWAAAGMLAAQIEHEPGEEPLLPLLLASRDLWPSFAAELELAADMDVGYRSEGTLVVALSRDDLEHLRKQYDLQRRRGMPLEWLSGFEARRREPHLAPAVSGAIFSPHDHQVDNRQVALALRAALLRAGGALREHAEVREVLVAGGRVRGVRLADEVLEADTVVLAAGSWSRAIAGLPESALPPVRPVKGQMLALQMPPQAPLISHVLWTPDAYLVPRNDGRLLIGATVEEQGFNTELTAGGVFRLLRGAWQALPAIEELAIVETWAGLRPGSRDDAPILGTTEVAGLLLATGHYRNGILLTPITAQAISELILTGRTPESIKPFALSRFAAEQATDADTQE